MICYYIKVMISIILKLCLNFILDPNIIDMMYYSYAI